MWGDTSRNLLNKNDNISKLGSILSGKILLLQTHKKTISGNIFLLPSYIFFYLSDITAYLFQKLQPKINFLPYTYLSHNITA